MSGAEIFGIAAAVLQIADLGTRVSVKLFGFARKVRGPAEKIDLISKEIAATGALLQQLSAQLDKDNQAQLLRRELVDSANELVQECQNIFKNIDKAIDGDSGNKIILSLKQKIHWTYLESEIDALRMNLEKLKSSIAMMQNLLIYAEQLRNREKFAVLEEQQDLLRALGEEKSANEQRYNNLMLAIRARPDNEPTIRPAGLPPAQLSNVHVPFGIPSEHSILADRQRVPHLTLQMPSDSKIAPNDCEVLEYMLLVDRILEQVQSKQYNLEESRRCRIHNGVLDIHWQEWALFRQYYGDDVLLKRVFQYPKLERLWRKRTMDHNAANCQEKASAGQSQRTSIPTTPASLMKLVGVAKTGQQLLYDNALSAQAPPSMLQRSSIDIAREWQERDATWQKVQEKLRMRKLQWKETKSFEQGMLVRQHSMGAASKMQKQNYRVVKGKSPSTRQAQGQPSVIGEQAEEEEPTEPIRATRKRCHRRHSPVYINGTLGQIGREIARSRPTKRKLDEGVEELVPQSRPERPSDQAEAAQPKLIDVTALLLQWTTLSPAEIHQATVRPTVA